MADSDAELQAKLRRLIAAYAEELPDKVNELVNRWFSLKANWTRDQAESLYRDIHSLSGSSGSYGATDLHLQSRELEKLLHPLIELSQLPPADSLARIDGMFGMTANLAGNWADKIAESEKASAASAPNEKPESLPVPDGAQEAEAHDKTGNTSFRLLYIEDNKANLNLVKQLVQAHWPNAELLTAEEPIRGLELLASYKFHVVLLDINLPVMNGFQVLQRIRENKKTKDLPVIAVSANAMSTDIQAGREAGFDEYITKPIKIDSFFEIIDQILAKKAV